MAARARRIGAFSRGVRGLGDLIGCHASEGGASSHLLPATPADTGSRSYRVAANRDDSETASLKSGNRAAPPNSNCHPREGGDPVTTSLQQRPADTGSRSCRVAANRDDSETASLKSGNRAAPPNSNCHPREGGDPVTTCFQLRLRILDPGLAALRQTGMTGENQTRPGNRSTQSGFRSSMRRIFQARFQRLSCFSRWIACSTSSNSS